MLNKVMLIGRLGRDPELRYAQNGTPIANLRIATDESYTDPNYLGKGSLVFVEGSLQTRKWQDQNGQDRYSTEIKAQRVQFLDRRGEGAGAQPAEGGGAPRRSYQQPSGQGGQGGGQGGQGGQRRNQAPQGDPYGGADEDLGPAFPSEASGMDDVPF